MTLPCKACVLNGTRMKGAIKVESSAICFAEGGRVFGNIQAIKNSGGVLTTDNQVDGILRCNEIRPPPTGVSNVVRGSKEDQCRCL